MQAHYFVLYFCLLPDVLSKSLYAYDSCMCHSSVGNESLPFLSSKRLYVQPETSNFQYTPNGCTPVKLWYYGRHGTRNPGVQEIGQIIQLLPALRKEILKANTYPSLLCKDTLEILRSWKLRPEVDLVKNYSLHEQGKYELQSIGARYKSRFPDLFPGTFSNASYYFRYANEQRAEDSAKAFVSSIFGDNYISSVWFPPAVTDDPLLNFYGICPKWMALVNNSNPNGFDRERKKFQVSQVMNKTIERVSQRLGLSRNLTWNEMLIAYKTCAFETGWMNGTLSPWCTIFDLEDFKVMAYREDLEYYWRNGYEYDLNLQITCPAFQDLLEFFEESSKTKKVKAYFSRSRTILKMMARLGLYKDTVTIRSENFNQVKHTYVWRTGYIDFMASHMTFVLYKCDNGTNKIGFFTQEIPTPLPACGNNAFCSYEQLRKALVEYTKNCDLEELCKLD